MDNKTFNRYRNVIVLEILSVLFGVIGLAIGSLSLGSIFVYADDGIGAEISNFLSISWTAIDCISIFFGFYAVFYSILSRKKDNKEENYTVIKAAKRSSLFDGLSIIFGLVGLIAAILSIVYSKDTIKNIIYSSLTILFDIGSVLFVVYSFHYLLTELWNGFKFVIKKTKNEEIKKARKMMTKKIKKQVEETYKDKTKQEVEEQIKNEFEKKQRKEIEKNLRIELEEKLTKKIILEQSHLIEAKIRREIEEEIEEKEKTIQGINE